MNQPAILGAILNLSSQVLALEAQENWNAWKSAIIFPLSLNTDLKEIIIDGRAVLTEATAAAAHRAIDAKGLAIIWSMVSSTVQEDLNGATSGSGAYKLLKEKYERSSFKQRVTLRAAFHGCVQKSTESGEKFVKWAKSLCDQLKVIGEDVSDTYFKDLLLSNLHESFFMTCETLLSRSTTEPTLEEVIITITGADPSFNPLDPPVKSEPKDASFLVHCSAKGKGRMPASHSSGSKNQYQVNWDLIGSPPSPNPDHSDSSRGKLGRLGPDGKSGFLDKSRNRRWGNIGASDDSCHPCGGHGHKAAWCVIDMPEDVKAWCLN